jgi:hypothetical protein
MLLLGAAAAIAAACGGPARAADGPWCAVFTTGYSSVSERCGLPSFAICRREAQFFGPTAFCRQDSYGPPWAGPSWRHRHAAAKRHHRHHRRHHRAR